MEWACAQLVLRTASALQAWVSFTPVRTGVGPAIDNLSGSGNFTRQDEGFFQSKMLCLSMCDLVTSIGFLAH